MPISPLTRNQWEKVLTALLFSFVSTFLAVFLAGGGIQTTYEATFALLGASFVAAINAVLYAALKLFQEED